MKFSRTFHRTFTRIYSEHSRSISNEPRTFTKLIPEETSAYFQQCVPEIFNNVINKRDHIQFSGMADHIKKIVDYNVNGGKRLRSSLTLHSYLTLAPDKSKEQYLYEACVLALVTDMVHACFVVSDDIMDEASIRRDKLCWHLMPKLGMRAINDIMLIRDLIYEILLVTFNDQTIRNDLSQMVNKTFLLTSIGQHLDYEITQIIDRNYSKFTMENYDKIVKYKTSYASLQLPVMLGLYLANKTGVETLQYMETMCTDITRLYQMQDDYFDCFQDVGKSSTDIENAKCSWLAVKALQHCSKPQRIVFKSCYGSPEIAHIERIQQLYKKLQLPQIYKDEEKSLYNRISDRAVASKDILPPKLFSDLLEVIYNRKL